MTGKPVILLMLLLFAGLYSIGQTKKATLLKTATYAGYYSYGKNIEKGRIGSASVYPESDSTILFYLDLNRGAPSYNMGDLYGRATIKQGKGIFEGSPDNADSSKSCKFSMEFKKDSLIIKTIDNNLNCPFGYGVVADGKFKRQSPTVPLYFTNQEGKKFYFNKIKPEEYYAPDNK